MKRLFSYFGISISILLFVFLYQTTCASHPALRYNSLRYNAHSHNLLNFNFFNYNLVSSAERSFYPNLSNKKILVFGDSITDSQNGKVSWVQYAMAALGNPTWFNFADGGAAFRQRSIKGVNDMPTQLANSEGHTEIDVVIVALGTNEYHNNPTAIIPSSNNPIVGSFDEAMAKDIADLSIEDTMYDAIRYAFYTIQQRWNCKAYVVLPIQRAAWNWKHVEVLYTALEEMATAYGFEIIDGRKCGIISDFEIKGKEGRDLRDGLHPNDPGKEKIAKMIVAKVRDTFVEL